MSDEYIIVSLKHTRQEDPYITLWNPENRGYCYRLNIAGRYTEQDLRSWPKYYNGGENTIAVNTLRLDETMLVMCKDNGYLDIPGYVFPNTEEVWTMLKGARYGQ